MINIFILKLVSQVNAEKTTSANQNYGRIIGNNYEDRYRLAMRGGMGRRPTYTDAEVKVTNGQGV